MYLKCRPHLHEFLDYVSKDYELIVYCAGSALYCDPALNYIEQKRRYFTHRIYNTHVLFECAHYSMKYYDFLLSTPRSKDNTVLVEAHVGAYSLLIYNGLPISPFNSYLSDTGELVKLAHCLKVLATKDSVYKEIKAKVDAALN